MALSKPDILEHLEKKNIIIDPFDKRNLNNVSYDVSLGEHFYRERRSARKSVLNPYSEKSVLQFWRHYKAERAADIRKKTGFSDLEENIADDDRMILLEPGETVLAHTQEFIGGRYCLTTDMKARSTAGRVTIGVCKCAGWGDIGYINRWTMEVTNFSRFHHVPLVVGRRYAQLVFIGVTPIEEKDDYSKEGKYQTEIDLEKLKQIWKPEDMLPKKWKDWELRK